MTFVLNLGVSFSIAYITALRAYNVLHEERLTILKYLLRQVLHSPLRFILPFDADQPSVTLPASKTAEYKN
jgi:site-specific recombinase